MIIEGRKDFRARTPEQIKEFDDEEKVHEKNREVKNAS
jgi:hypothetical protein